MDQPLPEIWNGFLDPDVTDDSFMFEANSLNDSMVFNGQDSLGPWDEPQFALEDLASQEIPLFNSTVTPSANTDTTTICYGMVSSHNFCPAFSIVATTLFCVIDTDLSLSFTMLPSRLLETC